MKKTVLPGERAGQVKIPASKSQAHRLLICAALGERETVISCDGISKDIAATAACLNALGSAVEETTPGQLRVTPVRAVPEGVCVLPCGESGSTLRFLLPVVGALGAKADFYREGRLPQRPLAPLDSALRAHGMDIQSEGSLLRCRGQLRGGDYVLPGNVSSQYISGLLMALPLLKGDSSLHITERIESGAYISMTEAALALSGIELQKNGRDYQIPGGQRAALPPQLTVEGDYSNAAFFLCMGALSREGVTVSGLRADSLQGDRGVLEILVRLGARVETRPEGICVRRGDLHGCVIDAAPVPDLIPVLSVVAAVAAGRTEIVNAGRLRLKESDRLKSTCGLLTALGCDVTELKEGLIIRGRERLTGGVIDSCGDHRIAMSAAVAACACQSPVTVLDAECVQKSYPRFWEDLEQLRGGSV